jgi:uncharacterized protein (DUF885 family)
MSLLAGASMTLAAHAVSFDDWADKVANAKVRNDPEQATQKQYFDAKEQDALDRKLTPNTVVFRAAEVAAAKKSLAELAKIDQSKLTPQQRASAATIAWSLQGTVDAYQYRDYNFVFNQFTGLHVQIVNFLSQQHPIRNRRDIENYLVRLKAVAGKMDTGIVQARGAAGRHPDADLYHAGVHRPAGSLPRRCAGEQCVRGLAGAAHGECEGSVG